MSMNVGPADSGDEDEVVSAINTTPLVDVMLVLLIIFLITIPVVTHTVPVALPKDRNQPTQTKPENIIIAVNKDGDYFWNNKKIGDIDELTKRLETEAVKVPQPEVHIRGDTDGRYEFVGKVVAALQRAQIAKVAFITQPPPHGG
jgi:biopolymer transport protein ExbD